MTYLAKAFSCDRPVCLADPNSGKRPQACSNPGPAKRAGSGVSFRACPQTPNKRVKGRRRYMASDTMGLLLTVVAPSAGI